MTHSVSGSPPFRHYEYGSKCSDSMYDDGGSELTTHYSWLPRRPIIREDRPTDSEPSSIMSTPILARISAKFNLEFEGEILRKRTHVCLTAINIACELVISPPVFVFEKGTWYCYLYMLQAL